MTLENLDMYFHPLMDINKEFILNEKMIERSTIKVLTYNTFLRPPFTHNNEDDYKDERLIDFVRRFENYDILALQEVFGFFNNRKHEMVRYANQSGLFYYSYGLAPSFFQKSLVDGGAMVLSRFPILEKVFYPFKYGILSDSLANKGVVYAKIQIRDAILVIFTLHTQATYFESTTEDWVSILE